MISGNALNRVSKRMIHFQYRICAFLLKIQKDNNHLSASDWRKNTKSNFLGELFLKFPPLEKILKF